MNRLYSFLRTLLYLPAKLVYPTKVLGAYRLPQGSFITVSNHLKWTDILILAINLKGYRHIMAKRELAGNKFLARVCAKLGVVLVNRGKADLSAVRAVLGALKKGEAVTMFPEGTRNRSSEDLQEVKGGAVMFSLKSGAPLVPVMILRRSRAFRRNYVMVGEKFFIPRAEGKLTSESLTEGEKLLSRHMNETKESLNDAVAAGDFTAYKRERRAYKTIEKLRVKTLRGYLK